MVNIVKCMYDLNYNTCITDISSKYKGGHQNDAHMLYLAFFESLADKIDIVYEHLSYTLYDKCNPF